jgi:hypothetical protein
MTFGSKWHVTMLTALLVLVTAGTWRQLAAEDVVHAVSGIVKSVDKGTKTMVVKTADGTEHTIKWTDKTTMKGVDATGKAVAAGSVDTYDGLKAGTKVSVKYTEKGGEKTAVAIKDASKAAAKAVTQ